MIFLHSSAYLPCWKYYLTNKCAILGRKLLLSRQIVMKVGEKNIIIVVVAVFLFKTVTSFGFHILNMKEYYPLNKHLPSTCYVMSESHKDEWSWSVFKIHCFLEKADTSANSLWWVLSWQGYAQGARRLQRREKEEKVQWRKNKFQAGTVWKINKTWLLVQLWQAAPGFWMN